MSNLDFLEISRNFKSYYQALRDAHYFLRNDPDLSQEELQAVTKVLSKLIYGFIRIRGVSFRDMNREQFKQEFNLFHQDFLNVIQNSGENNVEFEQFAALMDEIISIAVMRTIALGKIEKVKQQSLFENVEIDEVTDEIELDELTDDIELDLSSEDENNDAGEEMVEDMVEEIEVIDETQEPVAEVRPINNTLRTFSTDLGALNNEFQDESITNAGRTFSTDVEETLNNEFQDEPITNAGRTFSTDVEETLNNEVEVILYEIVNAEEDQPEPINEVMVAEAVNEAEEANDTPQKVKYRYIDAAPVVNNYFEPESSDEFRFRPRRRRNR
ncbi:hypothetical protein [Neobacillus sp. SuZ13]|uniref:hypothetical protein n=1 Tax=Neobacillus sp. SuZ13 TaxID=3047875 RepID=UPI0024BF7A66|nr:hypothetical protein [Neobacillus sp. SuZ13]WHY64804.1 hypothetical protein QNH17_16955 [Neobacillus sp. SuZ13]